MDTTSTFSSFAESPPTAESYAFLADLTADLPTFSTVTRSFLASTLSSETRFSSRASSLATFFSRPATVDRRTLIASCAAASSDSGERFLPDFFDDFALAAMTLLCLSVTAIVAREGQHHECPSSPSEQPRDLQVEQRLLALEPARIAGQRSVRPDDAVARHDDRDRVGAVRGADRARDHGLVAQAPGDVAIARGLAVRDALQLGPDLLLELRALARERQVELRTFAGEVLPQLLLSAVQQGVGNAPFVRLGAEVDRGDQAGGGVHTQPADRRFHPTCGHDCVLSTSALARQRCTAAYERHGVHRSVRVSSTPWWSSMRRMIKSVS